MGENNELNDLIYEYYRSRILFGIYRYGEQLKSIPQICTLFRVARNTVQIAFSRLEKNDYIKTERGKVARVVYQGSEEQYRENIVKYFAPRRDGILDFHLNGNLMFLPIWEKGMQNLKLDMQYNTGGTNTEGKAASESTILYADVLNTFQNGLMFGLFWQCLRYINYFYPPRNDRKANYVVGDRLSVEKANDLKRVTDAYYEQIYLKVMDFTESNCEKYHLEQEDQIPFKWTIYRKRPQVRYTLASTVIREILWDVYPVGSYLPSLPKMAERYQVSLITVRRTLDVLNSLGITRTYMGVGTKVCLESTDIDIMDRAEIRENLRLHGEAMQLLALTVSNVTHYTLESVKREGREELLQTIGMLHDKKNYILCIDVLLNFISSECPSAFIRESYGKLRELAVWGYIFSAVLMAAGQMEANLDGFICQLENDLRTDDSAAFAGHWQSFIEKWLYFFHKKFPLWNAPQDTAVGDKMGLPSNSADINSKREPGAYHNE
jgi:DNA-binding GntR family transcriptional regulator